MKNTKFGERWTHENLFNYPVIDTIKEVFTYRDEVKKLILEGKQPDKVKELTDIDRTINFFLIWH